jgi:hypothetical protein
MDLTYDEYVDFYSFFHIIKCYMNNMNLSNTLSKKLIFPIFDWINNKIIFV